MTKNFIGSLLLVKLVLRRERINSTLWILLTAILSAFIVIGIEGALSDMSTFELVNMLSNPAMVAMMGPVTGTSFGALYSTMMLLFTVIAVCVMNVMFIVRHTRADEEKGRYEVLRSLPIGRLANLNAAILSAVIINILLAVLTGLALFSAGGGRMDFGGSMLFGVLLGVIGLFFAVLTAMFAQVFANARKASGYSFMCLGVFYLMRAIGDVSFEPLSLLSPLGLVLMGEPFAGNYIWPIFVLLPALAIILLLAYRFNFIRDIDQGLIADKKGRAHGGPLVKNICVFTFKLLLPSLLVGAISVFILGASYGFVMGDVEMFVEANEFYRQLLLWMDGISLPILFVGFINFTSAIMALVPLLLYVLKIRAEEKEGRGELIVASSVSRFKYFGGFIIVAFVSSIVFQTLIAIGLWASAITILPEPGDFPLNYVLIGNLVYIPALLVIVGLAVFLVGVLPKLTGLIWAVYGISLFVGLFGRMDILPGWTNNLTPFGFIPQYPMEEIQWLPLVILLCISLVLTVLGLIGYRKRDINRV